MISWQGSVNCQSRQDSSLATSDEGEQKLHLTFFNASTASAHVPSAFHQSESSLPLDDVHRAGRAPSQTTRRAELTPRRGQEVAEHVSETCIGGFSASGGSAEVFTGRIDAASIPLLAVGSCGPL